MTASMFSQPFIDQDHLQAGAGADCNAFQTVVIREGFHQFSGFQNIGIELFDNRLVFGLAVGVKQAFLTDALVDQIEIINYFDLAGIGDLGQNRGPTKVRRTNR